MKSVSFLFLAVFSLCTTGSATLSHVQDNECSIYLAGPLFTVGEREFNAALAKQLRNLGYKVFLPQAEEPRELTAQAIFEMDRNGIDQSRVVVAIMDGPDPDSGTCWECGYAYGRGKPVIAVRTDFRSCSDGDFAPYNLMLSESASKHVHLPCLQYDLEAVVEALDAQLRVVFQNLEIL